MTTTGTFAQTLRRDEDDVAITVEEVERERLVDGLAIDAARPRPVAGFDPITSGRF